MGNFVSVCGYSNLSEYLETYRFLLENLKVMFPFCTDTIDPLQWAGLNVVTPSWSTGSDHYR